MRAPSPPSRSLSPPGPGKERIEKMNLKMNTRSTSNLFGNSFVKLQRIFVEVGKKFSKSPYRFPFSENGVPRGARGPILLSKPPSADMGASE